MPLCLGNSLKSTKDLPFFATKKRQTFLSKYSSSAPSNKKEKDKFSDLMNAAYVGSINRLNNRLKSGESINITDRLGFSAIHRACQSGNLTAIEILMDKGANLRAVSNNNETALHIAVFHQNEECVKMLLQTVAKFDINAKTIDLGMTALHMAVNAGNAKIVQMLIKANANPLIKNIHGNTVLDNAVFWVEFEETELEGKTEKYAETMNILKKHISADTFNKASQKINKIGKNNDISNEKKNYKINNDSININK